MAESWVCSKNSREPAWLGPVVKGKAVRDEIGGDEIGGGWRGIASSQKDRSLAKHGPSLVCTA